MIDLKTKTIQIYKHLRTSFYHEKVSTRVKTFSEI